MGASPPLRLPLLEHKPRFATEGVVAGADIGGTNQTVALAHLNGEVISLSRRRLREGGTAEDVIENVFDLLSESLAAVQGDGQPTAQSKLLRIGVGFGGPVDQRRGIVLTSHHVTGWTNYPLRETLERHLNAPAVVDNDANAAALGEALFGAGRGHHHLLYVNVGTGIGGGIVLNDELYHGAHGLAGEVGHITVLPDGPLCDCGKRGCLEALASGRSIGRRAREMAAADPTAGASLIALAGSAAAVQAPHVFQAATSGDAMARRLIEETAGYLGIALGSAANLLDVEAIVLGGGVSEAGAILFDPLARALAENLMPSMPVPEVVPAALGYDAGVAGALALALREL